MDSPWTKSTSQLLEHFNVDSTHGLDAQQAEKHAELYGKNGVLTCVECLLQG